MNLPKTPKTNDKETGLSPAMQKLAWHIQSWGRELGFQQLGISDIELDDHATRLNDWLKNGFHG